MLVKHESLVVLPILSVSSRRHRCKKGKAGRVDRQVDDSLWFSVSRLCANTVTGCLREDRSEREDAFSNVNLRSCASASAIELRLVEFNGLDKLNSSQTWKGN